MMDYIRQGEYLESLQSDVFLVERHAERVFVDVKTLDSMYGTWRMRIT